MLNRKHILLFSMVAAIPYINKQTEEKAKVVAAVWGMELNAVLANKQQG